MSQPGMRGIRTEPFLLSQGTGIIFENMLGQMSSGIRVVSYLHPRLPLPPKPTTVSCPLLS